MLLGAPGIEMAWAREFVDDLSLTGHRVNDSLTQYPNYCRHASIAAPVLRLASEYDMLLLSRIWYESSARAGPDGITRFLFCFYLLRSTMGDLGALTGHRNPINPRQSPIHVLTRPMLLNFSDLTGTGVSAWLSRAAH